MGTMINTVVIPTFRNNNIVDILIMNDIIKAYDAKYKTPNFFTDRSWLYRPFVKALISKAELRSGARLLDAGCGQGFFTALFAEQGIDSLGMDISSVGIEAAKSSCKFSSARFKVGDMLQLPIEEQFDCVFTRSCSLYNTTDFPYDTSVTDQLIRYLRPGGVLIFDYYSRLSENAKAEDWLYHSMAQVKEHFSKYSNAQVYFSLRLEARLLGVFSFSPITSYIANVLSRTFGMGGELVVFVRLDQGDVTIPICFNTG
jgi:SAM-dependent methyltransferase